eukprot:3177167-Rhodomonas_salina.1
MAKGENADAVRAKRDAQIRDFSLLFPSIQRHCRSNAQVMGGGDACYQRNICSLVAASCGLSMDTEHLKSLKKQQELEDIFQGGHNTENSNPGSNLPTFPTLTPAAGAGSGGGGGGGVNAGGGGGGARQGGGGGVDAKKKKREVGVHCPNSAEIVAGMPWAISKRSSCHQCSGKHEIFECPIKFFEKTSNHMPGWRDDGSGKPTKVPGMWGADGNINDACKAAWRQLQTAGFFNLSAITKGPAALNA